MSEHAPDENRPTLSENADRDNRWDKILGFGRKPAQGLVGIRTISKLVVSTQICEVTEHRKTFS